MLYECLLVVVGIALAGMDFTTRERVRGDGGEVATSDCIEVNHVYDETGKHRYSQVICWVFDGRFNDLTVADWCLIEKLQGIDAGEWWTARYLDCKNRPRIVRAKNIMRYDSHVDRERWNLVICKEHERLKLFE